MQQVLVIEDDMGSSLVYNWREEIKNLPFDLQIKLLAGEVVFYEGATFYFKLV